MIPIVFASYILKLVDSFQGALSKHKCLIIKHSVSIEVRESYHTGICQISSRQIYVFILVWQNQNDLFISYLQIFCQSYKIFCLGSLKREVLNYYDGILLKQNEIIDNLIQRVEKLEQNANIKRTLFEVDIVATKESLRKLKDTILGIFR